MNALYQPRLGAIILRTVLAVLLLFHGWAKISGGVGWLVGVLEKTGMPGFLAYAVYLGEVLAPLLLLAGIFVVPAALLVMINMVVAVVLMHQSQILTLNNSGGWSLELQAFYFFTALVVLLTAKPRG
ncbi:DoxX family protein [Comamonas flocculans]|uniref:DoxX family protein n=1 Tax=Comamonas flocculans TaxID=2597701 RepID=A0A5B8RX83_9BURK|nr:DoxX family protein [Comamonas flocculans]QEA13334.1 DoxX family protein [Comamonas flocculans]